MAQWALPGLALLLALVTLVALAVVALGRRRAAPGRGTRVPGDLTAPPGELMLVLFSVRFSAECRDARGLLAEVAAETPRVGFRDVDVAARPELVARLDVARTPTTLLVDGRGAELARVPGVPRRRDLLAALDGATNTG